jgi:6-phosphogluconolactonase
MSQADGGVYTLPDLPALARRVAEWLTAAVSAANGPFRILLSDGSIPKRLSSLLASPEFRSPFPRRIVEWCRGDERLVPDDHPKSNYRMAREAMPAKAPVARENIHPIPTDGSPEGAARRCERTQEGYGALVLNPTRPLFDVTFWASVPTVIKPRCCRKSPCCRNALADLARSGDFGR